MQMESVPAPQPWLGADGSCRTSGVGETVCGPAGRVGDGGAGWIGSGVSNSGGDGLGVPVTGPPSSPEVDMPGQRSPGTLARGTCRKPSSPLPLPRPQPASHLTSPSHLSLSHLLYLPPCSSPISLFHPFSQVLDISPHRPSRIAWNPAPAGWFCQVQWRHSPAGPWGGRGRDLTGQRLPRVSL